MAALSAARSATPPPPPVVEGFDLPQPWESATRSQIFSSRPQNPPHHSRSRKSSTSVRCHCGGTSTTATRARLAEGQTIGTRLTFQMSSQYSAMARSDENLPLRAVLRIDIRSQAAPLRQVSLTSFWQTR